MIDEKLKLIIEKFLNNTDIKDYIGIIVYGSYVKGTSNELSDLDLMIIKDNYDSIDCGSINIDNIRVEYFIEPIKYLYEKSKSEVENNDPSHLTKFRTAKIYCDKDGKIEEFLSFIKNIYETKINQTFDEYDKFSIFSIKNRLEDLYVLINDVSFYSVYFYTLEKIRLEYSKIKGIIELPFTKIERLYTDQEYAKKYINSEIHNLPDDEFISKYLECLKIDNPELMYNKINELYDYAFNNLDFDSSSFILKFKKNPPFKL